MKQILPFALILSLLSGSLVHAETNDELMVALQELKERVVGTTADEQKAKIAAVLLGTELATLGGSVAAATYLWRFGRHLPKARMLKVHKFPYKKAMETIGMPMLFFTIPVTAAVLAVYGGRTVIRRAGLKGVQFQNLDVHTAEGINEFWTLPVQSQYAYASQDEAFARYIIELNRYVAQAQLGFGIPQSIPQPEAPATGS